MVIECVKCESKETNRTQYKEEGFIVETSYTCKNCGHYVGTNSYGSWEPNEDDFEELENIE